MANPNAKMKITKKDGVTFQSNVNHVEFTLEELIESATASRLGINNQPSEKIISNLKALCEKVL